MPWSVVLLFKAPFDPDASFAAIPLHLKTHDLDKLFRGALDSDEVHVEGKGALTPAKRNLPSGLQLPTPTGFHHRFLMLRRTPVVGVVTTKSLRLSRKAMTSPCGERDG